MRRDLYRWFWYELAFHGIFLRENEKKLFALKNKYAGKRIFIIGNGPSLKKTDLTLLKEEITIGCNGLFLIFEEMGFLPTFYTVEDTLVAEDRAETINQIKGTTKIFSADLSNVLLPDADTIYANFRRSYHPFPLFSDNAARKIFWGGTVTMMNLQLAYFLGSREVYLVGVDHNYQAPAAIDDVKGCVITANTPDQNHFHPDYFGPGFRYHDPMVDRMEMGYKKAKEFFVSHNGVIFNATLGGMLEVFPRVSYYDLFGEY